MKWHEWRDDRPRSQVRDKRKIQLIESASSIREFAVDSQNCLEASTLIDVVIQRRHADFDCKFCDAHFDGMSPNVDAFFDASHGSHVFCRSSYLYAIYGEHNQLNDDLVRKKETVVHELAHVLSEHAESLKKRFPRNQIGTHMRLAHNAGDMQGRHLWTYSFEGIEHADLEEEAQIFTLALLTPIEALEPYLLMPINQAVPALGERFAVGACTAYNAALLAKDYLRRKPIRAIN